MSLREFTTQIFQGLIMETILFIIFIKGVVMKKRNVLVMTQTCEVWKIILKEMDNFVY